MIRESLQSHLERIEITPETPKQEKIDKILDLKICDPTCGGGSFLIATLDFLGEIFAKIVSGDDFPPRDILESSRRDILEHCIYGVDVNPFAIELTKLSLWIHACVKDKPLNFLNHHIKSGNSLIGTHIRKFLKTGKERGGQTTLLDALDLAGELKREFTKVKRINDNTIKNIKEKQELIKKIQNSEAYRYSSIIANAYIYRVIKEGNNPSNFDVSVSKYLTNNNPKDISSIAPVKSEELEEFAYNKKFFHWDLEFPEVFFRTNPGFDLIIGNPPYIRQERIDEIDKDLSYKKTLAALFPVFDNRFDFALYFLLKSIEIARRGGFHSFIITNKWLRAQYGKKIREYLEKAISFKKIIDLGKMKVFQSATVDTVIYLLEREKPKDEYEFFFSEPSSIVDIEQVGFTVSRSDLKNDT